jgi:hypothetical protein
VSIASFPAAQISRNFSVFSREERRISFYERKGKDKGGKGGKKKGTQSLEIVLEILSLCSGLIRCGDPTI